MKNTALRILTSGVIAVALATTTASVSAKPWSETFEDFNARFTPVVGNGYAAVWLDNETDLVWEWMPSPIAKKYVDADSHCFNLNVAGRGGWRLPEVHELRTMIDSTATAPKIHPGFPFREWAIKKSVYWTATPRTDHVHIPGSRLVQQWVVDMKNGRAFSSTASANAYYTWCVRAK